MTIGTGAPIACAAGSHDCWEAFASEQSALARYAKLSAPQKDGKTLNFAELVELALEGDADAQKALKETAHYIGTGISNLIQGLSPEVTIVAGTIVRAWRLIADEIKDSAENAICQHYPSVNIMPSTLGAYPTLMGAFSLILADKFASVSIS
jgi:predicted NBD/HSP70 family sugar kinase